MLASSPGESAFGMTTNCAAKAGGQRRGAHNERGTGMYAVRLELLDLRREQLIALAADRHDEGLALGLDATVERT